jgi:hypothetical protein
METTTLATHALPAMATTILFLLQMAMLKASISILLEKDDPGSKT